MTDNEPVTTSAPTIDPGLFRYVMGHYPTGVVVVTAMVDEAPVGMVLGTFASVSLDPPLVSFMPARSSSTWATLGKASEFVINVLGHDQQDACLVMARRDPEKFDKVAWEPSPVNGAPVLKNVVSAITCRTSQIVDGGDHEIVLCAVRELEVIRPVTPLLFFQGGYGSFSTHSMLARVETSLVPRVQRAQIGQQEMDELAAELDCECAILAEIGDDELVTAATANGPSTQLSERLGEVIPLMPPVGDLYVAHEDEEARERWIKRSVSSNEEVRQIYRDRLALARERGWSMSLTSPDDQDTYEKVIRGLQEYGAGPLTPARKAEIQQGVEEAAHLYAVREIEPEQEYFVGSIVAPLREPDGSVNMVIRISQLPSPVRGAQVRDWQGRLSETADRISARMAEKAASCATRA